MPCQEIGPTVPQHYRDYDDSSSGKSCSDSDLDSFGHHRNERAASLPVDRACSRGRWLKTLWTIIDRMEGNLSGGGRRPRQVKSILRPPTKYVFVTGMSGLPSKVAVYPKRMWEPVTKLTLLIIPIIGRIIHCELTRNIQSVKLSFLFHRLENRHVYIIICKKYDLYYIFGVLAL